MSTHAPESPGVADATQSIGLADATQPVELLEVMRSLSSISEHLRESYGVLARRAERVEHELSAANAALADKVRELDATRTHLETILQALPTGVVVRDGEDCIVRVNSAACAILRTSAEELLVDGSHPALEDPRAQGESREHVLDDGTHVIIAARRSPILAADGGYVGSVEILDDRTELVRLNERLHGLDKMAALGTMAGGIAHEIRNPMNAIQGFAKLLRRELDEQSRAYRYATRICEGVIEADAIISNMLGFADPERLVLETIDAALLVSDATEAALKALPEDADRSRWSISSRIEVEAFVADRIKVRQALRNLIANALQVQPDGGALAIELGHANGELELCVDDAGPGIPAHLRQRVADPFFTTRADGTGLGLALVQTIARLHGGRLEVCPRSDRREPTLRGAHMVFRIPFNPAR